MFDDITLEIAAIERRALAAVREKIAARQLGEAWIGLTATGDDPMPASAKDLAKQLRELRAEMKANGIKKTSCFNGGMDRTTQRYNERRFALETKLADAKRAEDRSLHAS